MTKLEKRRFSALATRLEREAKHSFKLSRQAFKRSKKQESCDQDWSDSFAYESAANTAICAAAQIRQLVKQLGSPLDSTKEK